MLGTWAQQQWTSAPGHAEDQSPYKGTVVPLADQQMDVMSCEMQSTQRLRIAVISTC